MNMGILNSLLGNSKSVDLKKIEADFNQLLYPGEVLESAFKVFRGKWIFTNKRLIIQDVQGITGKTREYHSIPYKSVSHFSIETAGTLSDDCEMCIWVTGIVEPYRQEFSKDVDVKTLQQTLAYHVMEG